MAILYIICMIYYTTDVYICISMYMYMQGATWCKLGAEPAACVAQMAMLNAPHVHRPALAVIATVLVLEVANVAQVV